MTISIMLVLQIDWDGLQPMTFLRNGLLRFNDPVDIDYIYATTGQLGSYQAQDLVLSTMDSSSSVSDVFCQLVQVHINRTCILLKF